MCDSKTLIFSTKLENAFLNGFGECYNLNLAGGDIQVYSLDTYICVIICPQSVFQYNLLYWRLIWLPHQKIVIYNVQELLVTKLFASTDLGLLDKWTPSSQRWLVEICWWYMNSKSFPKHRFFNSLFIISISINALSEASIDDTKTLLILWFLQELAIFRIFSYILMLTWIMA